MVSAWEWPGEPSVVLEKPAGQGVKYPLHMYRAFLTGIHLMEMGTMEWNLPVLNADPRLTPVDEFLESRAAGIGEW